MLGTFYNGRGDVQVGNVADPSLSGDNDAIVRVTLAGICGADIDFLKNGPEAGVPEGMRLGHEFVGVVEAAGKNVTNVKVGDRVVASAMFIDGDCHFCKRDHNSSCEQGGLFGSPMFAAHGGGEIQGGQSEYVRVPFASSTLFALPESLATGAEDARVLPLADTFATGYHGALNANIQDGGTVVVIGDGPVGQASALASSSLFNPEQVVLVGRHDERLAFGRDKAGATHTVNGKTTDPVEFVKELTGGYGTLSVIDSVGNQNSLTQALDMSQAGGKLSVLGFGHMFEPVDQPYTNSLFRNLTIHTGVVNVAAYMRKLMPMVESGQLDPSVIFTDTLPLANAVEGYDRMMNRNPGTIKVALTN